jgi:hypothetical protein
LLRRTWGLDVLRCPTCDGDVWLIAVITDEAIVDAAAGQALVLGRE